MPRARISQFYMEEQQDPAGYCPYEYETVLNSRQSLERASSLTGLDDRGKSKQINIAFI